MVKLIEKFTLDFGRAGRLSDESHYEAFEAIFDRVLSTLLIWLSPDSQASIPMLGKHGALSQFKGAAREIAAQIYYSDFDQCVIGVQDCSGCRLTVRIVMDPILVYVESE